jgi:hypothetical protein
MAGAAVSGIERIQQVLRQRPLCVQQPELAREMLRIAMDKARREMGRQAARRAQRRSPLVLGGQGRAAREVVANSNACAGLTITAVVLIAVLALWGGS